METLKIPKELQRAIFQMTYDIHITSMDIKISNLVSLYHNYNIFIINFNEHRDNYFLDIINKEREKLKDSTYRDELYRFLAQYDVSTNHSRITLSHFLFVALYSYYEQTLKQILLKSHLCSEREYKNMFRYKALKDFFIKELNIVYENTEDEDFILLEELRCLNNCIKHSGFVNAELHKANNKWVINQEINDLYDEFQRFIGVPGKYLKNIVEKIKKDYFKE
jgi:hypothetical protein